MTDDVYEADVAAVVDMLAVAHFRPGANPETARAVIKLLVARETQRQDEFVEQQVAEANLLGMDITDKGLGIRVTMARQTAASLVQAAKAYLDAHPGVENYVEQTVWDRHPETGEPLDRYIVTFHKPRGRSAHELRQVAERERDKARAALDGARQASIDILNARWDRLRAEEIEDPTARSMRAVNLHAITECIRELVEADRG